MARNEALRDGRWMLATVAFVLAPAWRATRVNPILALRSE
jgi:ABC-type lipoprotein release transport system permease subunit